MKRSEAGPSINKILEQEKLSPKSVRKIKSAVDKGIFCLETSRQRMLLKTYSSLAYPGMMASEKNALELLENLTGFGVPEIFASGRAGKQDYLLMEFLEADQKADYWEKLGAHLAKMHQVSCKNFGFEQDNFIGDLIQKNDFCGTAAEFYILDRLEPQFKLGAAKGFSFPNLDGLFDRVSQLIPDEAPALIHGDLWHGNVLPGGKGNPYLIDPAISYAPREMDLAMMKLFGGFSEVTFEVYQEQFPMTADFEKRLPLWQLYYLLVHLNLFGASYYQQVDRILKKFT